MTQAAMAAMARGIPPSHLWQDETHLTPALQRILARRILKLIETVGPAPQRSSYTPPEVRQADLAPDGAPFETISRQSALCCPIYLKLPLETPISFYAPSGSIYGVAYNSIQFAGRVEIVGAEESASVTLYDPDVETLMHKPGFDFRHRVIPIAPVRSPAGEALTGDIKLIPAADSPATYAEIECFYGGPLDAMSVQQSQGFFEEEAEFSLLIAAIQQAAA